jgi:uncharacterized protein (TIGR04551 family)
MPRLLAAALAALLLLPGASRAQANRQAQGERDAPPPSASRGQGEREAEVDPKVQEAIRKAVEKAKEEVRNEVRAELQGAQSAAEFMGAVAEGPKLEFLELDGYFRVRGQLLHNLSLGAGTDSAGYYLFPVPRRSSSGKGTLASANMRLRLEPTMNVSESVRVRAQIDVLDNYVLGSSESRLADLPGSPYPVPFYGSTRTFYPGDSTNDRDAVIPRRVWGEVQTPVGLLSFGRMPSAWGLGMLANAGAGIDSDFGDTVDRLQFATPPVGTPVGKLVFVPMLDFDAEGVLHSDPHSGSATGQPFDADPGDDARTYAVKIARLDTDDEIRRKLERGDASLNFGTYYGYRTQKYVYPGWLEDGFAGSYTDSDAYLKRSAHGHILDLWGRLLTGRWRVELEVAGVYGSIGNADDDPADDATTASGKILLRQWGGVLQTEFKAIPNRVSIGAELGMASGDNAPGFGNAPDRLAVVPGQNDDQPFAPNYGAFEGPQWGYAGDHSIRNFRFNPAYQVDLILFRRILGQVTDAWYLKPSVRWDILPGLALDAALVYSQAIYSESTPSSASEDGNVKDSPLTDKGKRPLGIEGDTRVTLTTGQGFQTWGEVGLLQPLGGLGADAGRAWVLNFGFAAKF